MSRQVVSFFVYMHVLVSRLLLRAARSDRLRQWARSSPVVRSAVRRFLPGEELADALDAAERLAEDGLDSVLTFLGENVEGAGEARQVREQYLHALEESGGRPGEPEISVKPTHLGLALDTGVARESMKALAEASARRGRTLWIDMETTSHLEPTLELYRDLRREGLAVGVCLQAYLYRTEEDLEELIELEAGLSSEGGVRLVKGAYDEPSRVAYPDREDVDENFVRLGRRTLDVDGIGLRTAFATHDRRLHRRLRAEARERDIGPGAYEFQMLYGIETEAQRTLAREGEAVRILISYGSRWFPWYMRRLAERPANLLFVLRQALPG